jgi:CheY-like chemotaxis protein
MDSPEALLGLADQALYQAKARGRNQVAVEGFSRATHEPGIEDHCERYGGGEQLLLVDCYEEARRGLSSTLRHCGFEVIEAPSGEQAIGAVERLGRAPDLVITDLIMPTMTGFRLVEELRKAGPPIRALYLTNDIFERDVWSVPSAGPYRFLSHPCSSSDLAAAAGQLLSVPFAEDEVPDPSPDSARSRPSPGPGHPA